MRRRFSALSFPLLSFPLIGLDRPIWAFSGRLDHLELLTFGVPAASSDSAALPALRVA